MSSQTRMCLFSDTVGDVNGVARFIRTIANEALEADRPLHVLTSQRIACPETPNVHNPRPRLAFAMPGYATLETGLPAMRRLWTIADQLRPTVIHISTPGPVGLAGWLYAKKRRLPITGTYHTDFPFYVDQLIGDHALTAITTRWMRTLYGSMARVFSRSSEYIDILERLGVPRDRQTKLKPGIDTSAFGAAHRDPSIWPAYGLSATSTKALYVGRVSVEKNLPMLVRVFEAAHQRARAAGEALDLVVIGDGPYRAEMAERLAQGPAKDAVRFLGFKHGAELAALYASSDVFLFPSTSDTLGQVVMESQRSGLPVLVTNKGGPREVVDHNRSGFVLDARDERAWIDTLVALAVTPDWRAELGAQGERLIGTMSIRDSFDHFWSMHADMS